MRTLRLAPGSGLVGRSLSACSGAGVQAVVWAPRRVRWAPCPGACGPDSGSDLNTDDERCSAREKPCEPRATSVPFGEKVREGLWEEAACELCLRPAERGLASGRVGHDAQKGDACVCAGNVGKEDSKAGKVDQSPSLKERAKEMGLSLKSRNFSKHARPAAPVCPGSQLETRRLQPCPRPTDSEPGAGAHGCGVADPLDDSRASWSVRTSEAGVCSTAYIRTGKFNSFPQKSGLKTFF